MTWQRLCVSGASVGPPPRTPAARATSSTKCLVRHIREIDRRGEEMEGVFCKFLATLALRGRRKVLLWWLLDPNVTTQLVTGPECDHSI
jgi:hypothetical protein